MNPKVFLVIPLLMLLVPTVVYADFFPYMDWSWNHDPIVCLNAENSTLPYLHGMLKSIDSWKNYLNNYTKTHNFNYKVYVDKNDSLKHHGICTLSIYTEVPTDPMNPADAIGMTNCIGNTFCTINIYKNTPSNYLSQTIQHEFGHALGLGHRMAYTKCDFMGVIISNDIMIFQAGAFRYITPADADALLALYNNDGFGGTNNNHIPQEFVVHPKPTNCTL